MQSLCDKGGHLAFLSACVSCVLHGARAPAGRSHRLLFTPLSNLCCASAHTLWATPVLMPHPRWGPRSYSETAADYTGHAARQPLHGPGGQRHPRRADEETEAQRFGILHRSIS